MRIISRMMLWLSLVLVWIGYMPKSARADDFNVPALTGRVNDEAGMLSPEAKEVLERKLAEYERATQGIQIAVLMTDDFQGLVIEEYSIRVASAWALGQKGVDNGVLITLNPDDRESRIEVGRGLEGILTDLHAGRIIQDALIPNMKRSLEVSGTEKQSYVDAAVVQTVEAVIHTIGSKPYPELVRLYEAEQARRLAETRDFFRNFVFGSIVVLVLVIIVAFVRVRIERKRTRITRLELIRDLESRFSDATAKFESACRGGSKYVTETRLRQYESDKADAVSDIDDKTQELRRLLGKDAGYHEWEKAYLAAGHALDPIMSAIAGLSGASETVAGIGNSVVKAKKMLSSAREAVSNPKVGKNRRDALDVQQRMLEGVISAIPSVTDAKAFDYLFAAATLAGIIVAMKNIRDNAISDITPKRKKSESRSSNRMSGGSPPSSYSSGSPRGSSFSGGGGSFSGGGASGKW